MKLIFYKSNLLLIAFFWVITACDPGGSGETKESKNTPESLGISSQAILNFIEAAETERKDELHSFILLRHGKVAAQGWWAPHDSTTSHMLYSLSKSFTSTAIGLAQAEGLLSIYDPVISFFPDLAPEKPSGNLQNMRIKDLLRMSSGHVDDTWRKIQQNQESWVGDFINIPVDFLPGTHFKYNTGATFMLSAIIQTVTGETLTDYLTPRLFEPLNIENPTWEQNMNGIDKGGTGLSIRTKDIANFGLLLLQEGRWQDKQLVPAEWIQEATALQTSNGSNPQSDWAQGYGYQFWRCRPEKVYRGDGAFGQYCIVMPEQDAVLAITSGTSNMQAILDLVWQHLLPAMKQDPITDDPTAQNALTEKLSNLQLSKVSGQKTSPLAVSLKGKQFQLEDKPSGIESISFKLEETDPVIVFTANQQAYNLPVGWSNFANSTLTFPDFGQQKIASSGAWTSEDTFRVRTYLYETPYHYDFIFKFDGDQLLFNQEINVSFDAQKKMVVKGMAR